MAAKKKTKAPKNRPPEGEAGAAVLDARHYWIALYEARPYLGLDALKGIRPGDMPVRV
jgi:hypothetical protein